MTLYIIAALFCLVTGNDPGKQQKCKYTSHICVLRFYAEGPIHKQWIKMVEQHYSTQLTVEQAMKIFLFC
jgi:hypothetical protein